ncbi:3-ketoacyl-thiolase peroxisomal [Micractinium conductrix]|uniref:acetyl-CoA C-acyltransferase n=1 Tax=Micractinium conductrix TaxID=554055 RepID=A0A2P6VRC7_9CHLO|nr:3-ketoacyl-thiolase peroxisomal [Micractinium conductrix]|eukprot:PSC76644.1 3-ketoacyl-thiolase peroxisomal [Micractinium conductrix]
MHRAAHRQSVLLGHLAAAGATEQPMLGAQHTSAGDSAAYERRPVSCDDVVIVSSCRTALCKAKRGSFKDTPVDDLIAAVLKETIRRTGVEPEAVGDVCFGSVMGPSSQRANECRIAMFLAGFPESVPVHTVNRQCSSGLQAIAQVAASIRAGFYTVGIAGGVESMTTNPMAWEGAINPRVAESQCAQDCLLPMGITSENVAAQYGVSRDTQDEFAARSHRLAAAAQAAGRFRDEIVPVPTALKDPKTGEEKRVVIDQDDGIRPGTTAASLGQLRPVFKKGGTTTAGNSSQVTDGAAAAMLMTRAEADRRGLLILGIFRSFAAVGVPPAVMGIGPAVAIPAAVEMAGLSIDDIDVFEINEAFASQAVYSANKLGLDMDKVNPNGGAIALGHPLGCTGARQTATLLYEMQRRGKAARFGVVSMCIGSGMGAAAVFERGGEIDSPPRRPVASQLAGLSRDAQVS